MHSPHHKRIQELLEANNRYLERARVAEAKLATMEADLAAPMFTMPITVDATASSLLMQRFGRGLRGNAERVVAEQREMFNEIRAKLSDAGIRDDGVNILGLIDKAVATLNGHETAAMGELHLIRSMLSAVGYEDVEAITIDLVRVALEEIGNTRKVLHATGHDHGDDSLDRLVDRAIDVERTRKEAALSEERARSQKRHNKLEDHLQTILKAVSDEFDKADIIPF